MRRIVLALGTIYLLWGSTYLAIRVGVETLPPLLMASARWLLAGTLLYSWLRFRGERSPNRAELTRAAGLGFLTVAASNGMVTWAETRIPSGLAALFVASASLWLVLLDWWRPGGKRPPGGVLLGVALGLFGVGLLVGPAEGAADRVDPLGVAALLLAALSFSAGSLASRSSPPGSSPLTMTSICMLAGGAQLLLGGTLVGEWSRLDVSSIRPASVAALLYLAIPGSLVAFTVYTWLLRATSPAVVSTYACVNPVVAVLLGWALLGEPLTPKTLSATVVIAAAVGLVILGRVQKPVPLRVPGSGAPGAMAAAGVGSLSKGGSV